MIFIDGEAKSGGKLLCFLGSLLKWRCSGGEAFRKPVFRLSNFPNPVFRVSGFLKPVLRVSGNGIGLVCPSCQGARSMRGMVMASQGTSGLLAIRKVSSVNLISELVENRIGTIISKCPSYILEGVLKARGCMLLMLSPLSQVTWLERYHTKHSSTESKSFNCHPGEARFPKLDQLSFCEWRWAGGRIVVESEVTQCIIAPNYSIMYYSPIRL